MAKRQAFKKNKEMKKLNAIVQLLPEDKRKLTEGLVADAAFMAEQLEILRADIQENGWSEEYQNGANQTGRKDRVEAGMYIKTQKLYAAVIKQLTDLLPQQEMSQPGADILDFIKKGE